MLADIPAPHGSGTRRETAGCVPQDFAAAVSWNRKAADQGHAGAQFNLGNFYENGRGVAQDEAAAARWYRKAADQGHAGAQNNLGCLNFEGRGGLPKDEREAARLFKLSADQGHTSAQVNLGGFYAHGLGGLPKDEREAARLYKLAADQGNAAAQFNLGRFYFEGRGGLPKDEREAARLYKLAVDQGNASGQANLGYLYEHGRGGLPKDDREAARLYKLAADQGNSWAQVNLGVFYEHGRGGLPQDERKAARLFKLAADQGNAWARVKLGFLYNNGRGGLPQDDREAARLYKLAADQGNANAQVNLAFFYSRGRGGLPKDDREAARLYKLAADQGNSWAQVNLGVFYEHGRGDLPKDDSEAARLYKLAADQGDADGQRDLGLFYSEGRGGLPKDDREAARLFKLAADQGNAWAQSSLGFLYSQGLGGLPKDDCEAARLFKLAADHGNALGQANLGSFYDNGRGGLPKDDREAARLFKLAADQGSADGQANLGVFFSHGRGGLPKDEREAARLFKLAADQGNANVQVNLAFFYSQQRRSGLGAIATFVADNFLSEGERKVLDDLKRWASCPHGVLAGKYTNRCEKCVRERKEIEENRRRDQELRERQERIERERQEHQQRIDAAADSLRNDEQVRLAKSVVPSIKELRGLTPRHFEEEVARMFERLGYDVRLTSYTKDGGRDAILTKDGRKYLVECKRYAEGGFSGRPDLQKFHSAIITDHADCGFFVTAGRFTKEANEFAATVPIKLIDQNELVRMMFDSKPATADDDSYRSMCRQCEDIISHRLRAPRSVKCQNGHEIAPTLDIESVLSSAQPMRRARRRYRFSNADISTGGAGLAGLAHDEAQQAREAIIGNTYPIKDQLKALGGRWNPDQKVWMVPTDKADQARALVAAGESLPPQKQPLSETEQRLFDKQGLSSGAGTAVTTNGVSRQGIQTGDRIVIRYLDDNKTATYTLSDARNDPADGVLSVTSPLGKRLLGLVEGDETEFEVRGRLRRVLIDHVIASKSELGDETSVEALMVSGTACFAKDEHDLAIAEYSEQSARRPDACQFSGEKSLLIEGDDASSNQITELDVRLDLEDTVLRLSSGEVLAGNDSHKLVEDARTIRNLLRALHSRLNE